MTDVILLGHGSADPRAAAQTQRLARQVDALLVSRGDSARIDCAYLDNHPDSLTAVLTRLETSCALIVPLFLANAFHVRSDIPAAIATARLDTGAAIEATPAVGIPVDLLLNNLSKLPGTGPVLLVSAGTTDASAQHDWHDCALGLERASSRPVHAVFLSHAQPALPEAMSQHPDACVLLGLLFEGTFADRVRLYGRPLSPVLADSHELSALVVARITEYQSGG